jgi:uracil-DNA glycosylase
VGCVVQVEVGGAPEPLSVVVQVVLDDGGVLLEMSIHPQQANTATTASARRMFFRLILMAHSFLPKTNLSAMVVPWMAFGIR